MESACGESLSRFPDFEPKRGSYSSMNTFPATPLTYAEVSAFFDLGTEPICESYWNNVISHDDMTQDCLGVPRWVWMLPCGVVLNMMERDLGEVFESAFDQTYCPWFNRPFNDAIFNASLFELGLNIWRGDSLFQNSRFITLMKLWVCLAIRGDVEVESLDALDDHDGMDDALDFWNDQD